MFADKKKFSKSVALMCMELEVDLINPGDQKDANNVDSPDI